MSVSLPSSAVQADVIDIRGLASGPGTLFVDANVLYWVFYPNFGQLGGSKPPQLHDYSRYWTAVAKANATKTSKFAAVSIIISEFAKTVEFAELSIKWQSDPVLSTTEFNAKKSKEARFAFIADLKGIRSSVKTIIDSALKHIEISPQGLTPEFQTVMPNWVDSCGDVADAVMVATAKRAGCGILSDDMDIATFSGITLFTANPKVIFAAKQAGKLRPFQAQSVASSSN